MDRRKHYGRKIKKTKNLYRRKKTAGQKAFGTVMLVLAVSAIAFLGFCIGKPLLDYFAGVGKDQTPEWTPAASYAQMQGSEPEMQAGTDNGATDVPADAQGEGTAPSTTPPVTDAPLPAATSSSPSVTTPVSADALVSTEVHASALANRSSLSAVLAKAKADGYNSAVVQLKDRNGYFRYKTQIEGAEEGKLITGTMTLDEIISAFKENGMVPIAEIAVLSDHAGCEVYNDMNYKCIGTTTSWLDAGSGMRRWANPESTATREYFAKVSAELMTAGFEHILLTDVMFPNFQHYDAEFIAQKYFSEDRYKFLYNVVKAGNMIEMKALDVITLPYGRTAEVLNDVTQLHDNSIGLVISRKDLTTENGYPADAKTLIESVLMLAEKRAGGLKIVPIIDSSSFDDAEKSKIIGTLSSIGYESFIIR